MKGMKLFAELPRENNYLGYGLALILFWIIFAFKLFMNLMIDSVFLGVIPVYFLLNRFLKIIFKNHPKTND